MSSLISQQLQDYASRTEGWDKTLDSLRRESLKDDPAALAKAAREFEAFFIHYMLKVMRETIPEGGLLGDGQEKALYTSMLDQALATNMAQRGGMGLADLIQKGIEAHKRIEDKEGDRPSSEPSSSTFQWPLEGKISSPFGFRRDPISGQMRFHRGVDLVQTPGSDILAAAPGDVAFSGEKDGYGRTVILRHPDGYMTLYAHNLANLVKEGEKVSAGQPIALLGSSGRSTGPHLHFEVLQNEKALDPLSLAEFR